MSNKHAFVVINGVKIEDKKLEGMIKILTPGGEYLMIEEDAISQSYPIETTGELGIQRFYLKQDGKVWLGITPEFITELSGTTSNIGLSTITKWLDDGGTISKSRDDLGMSDL